MRLPKFFTGKRNKRRVFGFLCTDGLIISIKILAKEFELPIYCIAEHALQLGGAQMVAAIQDKEAKEDLQAHLVEEHLLRPILDPDNDYDVSAIGMAQRRIKRYQEHEQLVRKLVHILEHEGVPPELLIKLTKRLIIKAREVEEYDNSTDD